MAAPKPVVTEREVRLARAFLHALGANETSGYLLLAIIAWSRAMTQAKDPYWKTLYGLAPAKAGSTLAAHLKGLINAAPAQYTGLLAALRRRPETSNDQVAQARDFLLIIQTSNYDAKHYGYKPYVAGHWGVVGYKERGGEPIYGWIPDQNENDPLAVVWGGLTGHPIPPKWFTDVVKPAVNKAPQPPAQPRSLMHVRPDPHYINPYAAVHFYDERPHSGSFILPVD